MTAARTIDHIGIVVDDLDKAVRRYSALLGTTPELQREMTDVGLRVAMFRAANIRIELLQYTGQDSFARTVMGGESGLNHVAVAANDLAAETARLAKEGLVVQPGFPRRGAHGQVTFFERDPMTGVLLELCEVSTSGIIDAENSADAEPVPDIRHA